MMASAAGATIGFMTTWAPACIAENAASTPVCTAWAISCLILASLSRSLISSSRSFSSVSGDFCAVAARMASTSSRLKGVSIRLTMNGSAAAWYCGGRALTASPITLSCCAR